jgi:enediyne biosynthesis protein E4
MPFPPSTRILPPLLAALLLTPAAPPSQAASNEAAPPPPIHFEDVAKTAGLDFTVENSPTPQKHMVETMAGGLAVFDYNNDGRADIFFANGAEMPAMKKTAAKYNNRLYRNDGNLKFTDVTAEAGLAGAGYSMGAAAADYDNDGNVDLFVAGVYKNILYHNTGKGTFTEVAKSGIKSDRWSVAAGWFDYDNDGRLDLIVINYADWTPAFDRFCGDRSRNIRVYCHPKYFEPIYNQLYHNRGDGTFEDVTESSGIGAHRGRGMSVAFVDADQDGYLDAFVTNDNLPNFLFHNEAGKTFEENALIAGVALLDHGKPVSSMGADIRDYDNDGHADISVTALTGETYPLFRGVGDGFFEDATYRSHLAQGTAGHAGWGLGFADFNNDGWKDLFTANAHVNDLVEMFESTEYKQANSVFVNEANGTFRDVSSEAGEGFGVKRAHRGIGFADFDGDGRIDVVVSALAGPAELWHNVSPTENHWLRLKLKGTKSNRDGIGAQIQIGKQHDLMTSAVGYASSSHGPVQFGLGAAETVEEIEIHWPSGTRQTLKDQKTNQTLQIQEPQ